MEQELSHLVFHCLKFFFEGDRDALASLLESSYVRHVTFTCTLNSSMNPSYPYTYLYCAPAVVDNDSLTSLSA